MPRRTMVREADMACGETGVQHSGAGDACQKVGSRLGTERGVFDTARATEDAISPARRYLPTTMLCCTRWLMLSAVTTASKSWRCAVCWTSVPWWR